MSKVVVRTQENNQTKPTEALLSSRRLSSNDPKFQKSAINFPLNTKLTSKLQVASHPTTPVSRIEKGSEKICDSFLDGICAQTTEREKNKTPRQVSTMPESERTENSILYNNLEEKTSQKRLIKSQTLKNWQEASVRITPIALGSHDVLESKFENRSKTLLKPKKTILEKLTDMKLDGLMFSRDLPESKIRKYLSILHSSLRYSKKIDKPLLFKFFHNHVKLPAQPKNKKLNTLFLDLDETLVHRNITESRESQKDQNMRDVAKQKVTIKVRPYTRNFLQSMANHFEVFIFTAGSMEYAESITQILDPKKEFISGILDRSCCYLSGCGSLIKDLRIIANREIKNMVIVDNLVQSFAFQLDNGIPVMEWNGDPDDRELAYLEKYLLLMANCEDIPRFNRRMLKLIEFGDSPIESYLDG